MSGMSPVPPDMRLVAIESPYASADGRTVVENEMYARACMRDSLARGEAPFLSHLLYTQVLDDLAPADRALGIEAGLQWSRVADATVCYCDYGISRGMHAAIRRAYAEGRVVEFRSLYLEKGALATRTEDT